MSSATLLDAEHVLRDLAENWRAIGKEGGSGVLRACAMTFIVLTGDDDDPQALGETLATLMKEHPSRTIVIRRSNNANAEASSRATVQCWMPFGRRQQICSEQIEIEAPAGRMSEVMPVILGVLVPDLPVQLWLKRYDLAFEEELAPVFHLAGRILIDTKSETNVPRLLEMINALKKQGASVGDLAWTRITRWRETVQQVFRTPSLRTHAKGVEKMEVSWAGPGFPISAAYLASWLTTVWPKAQLSLRRECPDAPPDAVGRIRAVRLSGQGFDLTLDRPEGVGVAIQIPQLQTHVVFPLLDCATLLRDELKVIGRDSRFESMLNSLQRVEQLPVESA